MYQLTEQARLRCEDLAAQVPTEPEWAALRRIHRELGMAGWLTGSELDSGHRQWLLTDARDRSRLVMFGVLKHAHALAANVILAEDVITQLLAEGDHGEHWYQARMHLLTAEVLLDAHMHSDPGKPA